MFRGGFAIASSAIFFFAAGLIPMNDVDAAAYYVDQTGGNDSFTGTSSDQAWKTIGKVNGSSFNPGDSILFKRGEVWNERLMFPSSGTSGLPITVDAYGTGANPLITGATHMTGFAQSDLFQDDGGVTSAYNTYDNDLEAANPTTNYNGTSNYIDAHAQAIYYTVSYPNIVGSGAHQIPASTSISSASLTLTMNSAARNTGKTIEVYRITRNWNPASNESTATYNTYDGSNAWTTPGGDIAPTPIATYTFTQDNPATITIDMTAAVQEMVNGTANYGWVLKYAAGTTNTPYYQVRSRNHTTPAYRPLLTVNRTVSTGSIYAKSGINPDPQHVFQDGARLYHASSYATMTAGSYFYDSSGQKLYVWSTDGANPDTHLTEVSTVRDCVDLNGKSYITFSHLDTTKAISRGYVMERTRGSTNITITNATSTWNGNRGFSAGDARGAYPTSANILFQDLVSHDNLGEGMWIGSSTNSGCVRCEAYNGGVDIRDKNYSEYGGGVILGEGCQDCYLRDSYVHDSGYNYTMMVEYEIGMPRPLRTEVSGNVFVQSPTNTSPSVSIEGDTTTFMNNVVYGAGVSNLLAVRNGAVNSMIYNNTFHQESASWAISATNATTTTITNNIIDAAGTGWLIGVSLSAQTGFVSNHNYLADGGYQFYWEGAGTPYPKSVSAWRTASGQDLNSSTTPPVFVDLAGKDFHLQASSPGIDAGVTLASVPTDKDGITRPQQNGYDFGAYEYHVTSSQSTPSPSSSPSTSSSSTSSGSSGGVAGGCTSQSPGLIPPSMALTRGAASGSIHLTLFPGSSPFDHYTLLYGPRSGTYLYAVNTIPGSGVLVYTVEGLSSVGTYYFRLREGNGCADGPESSEASFSLLRNEMQITAPPRFESTPLTTTPLETAPSPTMNGETMPAQSTHVLRVKVTDAHHQPLVGAKVTLHSRVVEATTDSQGVATFSGVEPGKHTIIITYENSVWQRELVADNDWDDILFGAEIEESPFALNLFIVSGLMAVGGVALIVGLFLRARHEVQIKADLN